MNLEVGKIYRFTWTADKEGLIKIIPIAPFFLPSDCVARGETLAFTGHGSVFGWTWITNKYKKVEEVQVKDLPLYLNLFSYSWFPDQVPYPIDARATVVHRLSI